jgi:Flp pilus assembly protein TadG
VIPAAQLGHWRKLLRGGWRSEHASQVLEFAIALPVLLVFVVGIFDFSSAFTLKQKLTNVARDAARVAAADPANDLTEPASGGLPASVADAFQVVDNYLQANKINDCGVTAASAANSGLTWTFTANGNGCAPAGITLIINRGYYFPTTSTTLPAVSCAPQNPNGGLAVVATCVSIQYAYRWRYGHVASLFGTVTLPTSLTATAAAMNEN